MVRPVCCEVGVANNIGWRRLAIMGGANHVCVYLADTGMGQDHVQYIV